MGRTLSERESKRLVAEFGVPVVAEREVRTAAEAARAADEIGLPVVVKLNGAGIAHKTERGLVRLGQSTPAQVQTAADELLGLAQPEDGDVTLLVAPMIGGGRELIAGIHHDAQFGRCVMVGIGGVHAEATADVAFALVPIDEVDALEMIEALAGQALLGPVRGEDALDRHAVAAVLKGLSKLAIARPDIEAVDLNPLMITDGRPIAVDALVEVAEAAS
jgi:acetyl-CoA synthetase (ADP-forming)